MKYRTPLARVRGLGSAREGTHHWIVQRVGSVALIPLTAWFLYAAFVGAGGYADARSFVAQPWNAALLAAFVLLTFHHTALGLQVVVEDYVHARAAEVALQILIKFACFLAAVVSLLAIVRIALGA
jgi:succinate dehydrogenase / fumarate reductase, membrane anchor subunit